MARRSLRVADVVEVLEHWAAGRPLRAIAESLGLDRHTVRKYVTPARVSGFGPGAGPPPEGWAAFVARVCPELGRARRTEPPGTDRPAVTEKPASRRKRTQPTTSRQRSQTNTGR